MGGVETVDEQIGVTLDFERQLAARLRQGNVQLSIVVSSWTALTSMVHIPPEQVLGVTFVDAASVAPEYTEDYEYEIGFCTSNAYAMEENVTAIELFVALDPERCQLPPGSAVEQMSAEFRSQVMSLNHYLISQLMVATASGVDQSPTRALIEASAEKAAVFLEKQTLPLFFIEPLSQKVVQNIPVFDIQFYT